MQLKHKYEQLPDVFEGWEELALIIEPFCKEVSDTFDISVKIPTNKVWKSEQKTNLFFCFIISGVC